MFKGVMLTYSLISLVCLCLMLALAAAVIYKFIIGVKRERLNLMRNYKKGWFAIIYFFALPLFWMGIYFGNQTTMLDAFLNALVSMLDAVVFDFSTSDFLALFKANPFYAAAFTTLVTLIICNALIFFLSVGGEHAANSLRVKRLIFNGCGGRFKSRIKNRQKPRRIYIIAGYNGGTKDILNSFQKGEYAIVLDDLTERKNCIDDIFLSHGIITGHGYKKVNLASFAGGENFAEYITRLLKLKPRKGDKNKPDKYEVRIIINTEDDNLNIILASQLLEIISQNAAKEMAESKNFVKTFEQLNDKSKNTGIFDKPKGEFDKKVLTDEDKTAIKKKLYQKFCSEAKTFVYNNLSFEVYAFNGDPDNALAESLAKSSYNRIHIINKYDRIAMNFERVYPLTRFMGKEQLNYENGTLKKGININVVIVGLGSTNQQILPLSIANNQFMRIKTVDGKQKIVSAPVNYWIYDVNDAMHNKSYNFSFLRYFREEKAGRFDGDDYYPKPDPAAYCGFYKTNINTEKFYNNVKSNLLGSKGELANENFFECGAQSLETDGNFNYIIIGCGADVTNCEFAVKLAQKLKEWGMEKNTRVFAKVRDNRLGNVIDKIINSNAEYYTFGNERTVVYNLKHILNERYETRAFAAHVIHKGADKLYSTVNALKLEPDENSLSEICKYSILSAYVEWMEYDSIQRQNNIYSHLNLRFKINLLGFDICDGASDKKDVAEFRDKIRDKKIGVPAYDEKNYSDMLEYLLNINSKYGSRKKQKDYITNDSTIELQDVLAAQEHQRWNANYIVRGMVPAPKTYSDNKEEAINLRMHYNITTCEGLAAYRDEVDHDKPKRRDVINYDYKILTESEWLITFDGRDGNEYGIEKIH